MQQIEKEPKISLKQYIPLFIIFLFSLLMALCVSSTLQESMYRFMGFFLVLFSLFKWIDIQGFIRSFAHYDLLHKIFYPYLLLFPILETLLGLSYISLFFLKQANVIIILMMSMNAISIAKALINKQNLSCACLGSAIPLPLSTISLFETALMLIMAVFMLLF